MAKTEAFVPNEVLAREERAPTAPESVALSSNPAAAPVSLIQVQEAPAAKVTAAAVPVPVQPRVDAAAAPKPVSVPAPAPSPAPAASGLPKIQTYDLPLQDLAQVAESSGLQWVNSDAAKIAEAKAAIAAEVKPIQVPRERPVVVVSEEAPLVLVETKRDLGTMALPFEKSAD